MSIYRRGKVRRCSAIVLHPSYPSNILRFSSKCLASESFLYFSGLIPETVEKSSGKWLYIILENCSGICRRRRKDSSQYCISNCVDEVMIYDACNHWCKQDPFITEWRSKSIPISTWKSSPYLTNLLVLSSVIPSSASLSPRHLVEPL